MQSLPNPRLRSRSLSIPSRIIAKYNGAQFRFVDEPANDLYCRRCGQLAYDPHQTKCCNNSLLWCKNCVPTICSYCKKTSECFPDGISNKRILQLKVTCPNTSHWLECSWEGALQNVSKHRTQCPKESILCSYNVIGCTKEMCRGELKTHESERRDAHLDLVMKTVVSMAKVMNDMTTTIKELKEQQQQQENAFNKLKEKMKQFDLK